MELSGRRCLVTGAASGIGRAIALRFAAAGAMVAGVDRDADGLSGMPLLPVVEDLAADAGAERACICARTALGTIDILVNAAGISRIRAADAFDDAETSAIMAINLIAPMRLCAAVLPGMRNAGGGAIVNLVSELALVAQPGFTAYCASKGGLLAYTRALALECAPVGIRVNALCPGPIDTPMLQAEFAACADPELERVSTVAGIPIGRLGRVEEVAEAALFLATAPPLIQGAALVADGGKTLA